jgi:hypothetical protein
MTAMGNFGDVVLVKCLELVQRVLLSFLGTYGRLQKSSTALVLQRQVSSLRGSGDMLGYSCAHAKK